MVEEETDREYIKMDACVKGGVYDIDSRNLSFGVYDGKGGFIGIRYKFGDRYLDTEMHWDTGAPHGTVHPNKLIEMLPESITACHKYVSPEGYSDFAVDDNGVERPVIRRDKREDEPQHGNRNGFVDEWADTKERLPLRTWPHVKSNMRLFQYLDKLEKKGS